MAIFMIGIQRSGSNLLRLMLNELPEIAAPHPPHILQRMMPLVSGYGDVNKGKAFSLLVDDVCRLVELNPVPWEGVVLDRKDVAARCRKRNLVAVFGAVYDVMAEAWNAKTWCCKSLANVYYLHEIEDYFERAKYIYLYRDGRDVAVSFSKAVVGEKHFYHIAKEWDEAQRLALTFRDSVPSDRFFNLSYEQLTTEPEKTARALCAFLGVAYKPSMLEFYKSNEAKRAASASNLWENVTNPVMKQNSGKFLKDAREDDIRIFESVAGGSMDALGYERLFAKKGQELRFASKDLSRFDLENKRRKEEVRKQIDPADLKRRGRQEDLIKEIGARNKGSAMVG
jgi:sulfotransferase family protein